MPIKLNSLIKRCLFFCSLFLTTVSCSSIISNVANDLASNLSLAIINQEDPQIVRDGAPAYLLLLDSLVESDPRNPVMLSSAAKLYASYGGIFVNDEIRSKRLTNKALGYSNKALCLSNKMTCLWNEQGFDEYLNTLALINKNDAELLLNHAISSLAYTRAHSSDWNAIARLPHIQAMLEHYIEIAPNTEMFDSVYTYLGILSTLRPPALGGDFEKGKSYFELAIEISGGKNLSVKVEYANGYAKPLYDRELHDKLLSEVLLADPIINGYTLTNILAQEEAVLLLESADDYF
tara:strand:- start:6766 stop:7641 length:876 start_codon:yes stop_codon:yes gene_type:complete